MSLSPPFKSFRKKYYLAKTTKNEKGLETEFIPKLPKELPNFQPKPQSELKLSFK